MTFSEKLHGAILGLAVGDALGVPYEFLTREQMNERPATDMVGFGTHNQPPGTWSDDSSLTFCLMETLIKGYDLQDIAKNFVRWRDTNFWTPHGHVFDIGITTQESIQNIKKGHAPEICGGFDEYSNGNGSLMRILPLAFFLGTDIDISERYQMVKEVSSLTHAHLRSVIGCFIYTEYAMELLNARDKMQAYLRTMKRVRDYIAHQDFNPKEIAHYQAALNGTLPTFTNDQLTGDGYVVNSLNASIWCFLNTDNYGDAVLRAVNLGEDTDTTAAITGGLAGLHYGLHALPEHWITTLAKLDNIKDLIRRFELGLENQ